MANDCWNSVTITGDSDTLKKLYDKFDTHTSLNYNNYHEMFETDVSDMQGDDWGPKWFQPNPSWDGDDLIVTGDSAWVPTIEFFEMISAEYSVKCDLSYDEKGLDFAGRIVMNDGIIESSDEWTYWEHLYLNDRNQFEEEIAWAGGYCETFDEVVDNIALEKWKVVDTSTIDLSQFESIYEKGKIENA